jgi:hypothetical protein
VIAQPPELLRAPGVWTGTELVIWNVGYAYDPIHDQWRALAPAPVPVTEQTHAVAVGSTVFVVTASGCTPQMFCVLGVPSARLDLATGVWSTIASPQVRASVDALGSAGGRPVYWARQPPNLGPDPVSYAYDAVADTWRLVDEPPGTGQSGVAGLVRTGRVTAWVGWYTLRGFDGEMRAARFMSDAWQSLSSLPHSSICGANAVWGPAGSAVVTCSSTETLLLDVVRDRWHELPRAPQGIGEATWTGRDLFALSHHGRLMVLR